MNFLPLSALPHVTEQIRAGERAAGRRRARARSSAASSASRSRPRRAWALARFLLSAYATVPVYEAFFRSHGWGEALDPMVDAWNEGDRKRALELAPEDLIREIVIFGAPEEQRARLEEFTAGGITTPVLSFLGSPDQLPGLIDALAP